jgi:hypothetical protein
MRLILAIAVGATIATAGPGAGPAAGQERVSGNDEGGRRRRRGGGGGGSASTTDRQFSGGMLLRCLDSPSSGVFAQGSGELIERFPWGYDGGK